VGGMQVAAERPLEFIDGILKQRSAGRSTGVIHEDVYGVHIGYGLAYGAQIFKIQCKSLVPVSVHFCNQRVEVDYRTGARDHAGARTSKHQRAGAPDALRSTANQCSLSI
jgi:hypothetical protein